MVTIKSFDLGEFDAYLALPASGYGPGIVVLQEIFGVNPYMRSVADWYAAHGFVALCPDLFWRIEPGVQLTDKGDDWNKAVEFYQKIDEAKAVEDSAAAMEFLRRNTSLPAKITLPGPFTMGQQARDDYYKDPEALVMDMAAAVNEEIHDLVRAGADVIQLDEPWVRNDPTAARRYAVKAINRALEGVTVPTVVHLCFGYAFLVSNKPASYFFLSELADSKAQQISIESAQPNIDLGVLKELSSKKIMLGVINLADQIVERPEQVAERIRAGLKHVSPDRLIPAPDCGMKYLSREVAFGKLKALADGAAIVRGELS